VYNRHKQTNGTTYFAAADCTGHGVPGAFMSVIGISFLNEIIQQKTKLNPSLILEKLREQVKLALNPELNEQKSENYTEMYINCKIKDGMDMALCSINNKTKMLNYSGANLPLLIIRESAFIEFEPTGNPIGVYLLETPFKNHKFQLQSNDIIYLFSDGYYDQFGGENNKKFYVEKFKKLLLEIYTLPCKEQNEILTSTIEEWQGASDQIDDILVMGLRI
jgi:serine phosphatase RsbU (regulator of sigma subunit)